MGALLSVKKTFSARVTFRSDAVFAFGVAISSACCSARLLRSFFVLLRRRLPESAFLFPQVGGESSRNRAAFFILSCRAVIPCAFFVRFSLRGEAGQIFFSAAPFCALSLPFFHPIRRKSVVYASLKNFDARTSNFSMTAARCKESF